MTPDDLQQIADKFVTARNTAQALSGFPGEAPATLEKAYLIQDLAIRQWPDRVAGWKVGRIPEHLEDAAGSDRLAGPIFSRLIHRAPHESVTRMPMFEGGFGAIEAEFIAVIGSDAPADKRSWSLDESMAMIGDLRIGIEIASSPLAPINELGPAVVVSDFGNNAGLIVGPSIADWSSRDLDTLACESFVDGRSVGTGGAFRLTGGYLRSVQFMLELAAGLGRPLRAGDVIATGQTNGIHDVLPGQRVRVVFGTDGELSCDMVAAAPAEQEGENL